MRRGRVVSRAVPGASVALAALVALGAIVGAVREGATTPTLADYRYFRRLSIDLLGRPPTRDELARLEQPGFDFAAWIDAHLSGTAYAERLRRIYMDALRLEVGPQVPFVPAMTTLRQVQIAGPDGAPIQVWYRRGQRRVPVEIDGDFCFTADETGLKVIPNEPTVGFPRPVPQDLLDARTVAVKPWWLYADYRAAQPVDRVGPDWATRFPHFALAPALLHERDGKTPITEVRVCKEEAQTAQTGVIFATGRASPKKDDPLPPYRATHPPGDPYFAKIHKGRAVSCLSGTGFQVSVDCGCGPGLERCLPSPDNRFETPAFVVPTSAPLGLDAPFATSAQTQSTWVRMWWAEEAKRFFDRIFEADRDVRELLTSRATMVNGPLAQFYRYLAGATCCGSAAELGYTFPESLVEPTAIPSALVPQDTATWLPVADRGPHASGILTMPIFLAKYGSRRARAHVLYQAFLCKSFVAEAVELAPSDEPDLTRRAGCAACHRTLEPMAAYFTRIAENDWTYLPARHVPSSHARCTKKDAPQGYCKALYEHAFGGAMRGAHAAPDHAERGPAGLAADVVASPDYAPCVVQRVAESFLGRALVPEDDAWRAALTRVFVDGGYRMRPLVRAIATSPRYREGNDAR